MTATELPSPPGPPRIPLPPSAGPSATPAPPADPRSVAVDLAGPIDPTPPPPRATDLGTPGAPPPDGPRRRGRRPPPAGGATVLVALVGAGLVDLAVQGRWASVAGVATVVTAVVLLATTPMRRSPASIGAAVLALLVASNLVLRASAWVIGPSLVAIGTLLLVAALDPRAALRALALSDTVRLITGSVAGVIGHLVGPARRLLGDGDEQRRSVLRGGAIAASVVLLLTLLLASADAVVGALLDQVAGASTWAHLAVGGIALLGFGALSGIAGDRLDETGRWSPAPRAIEARMGLGAVVAVLGGWVAVQATVAAGGADRLLATVDVTRAEYAREGFFELVVVVAVVLALLTGFRLLLGDHRSRLDGLLVGAVGALTLVLVAVTYSRLALYIDAFGLTMLRLSVAWFLGWLAAVVAVVTIRGCSARIPVAPIVLVTAALTVVAFGWSNPEATVAATNTGRADTAVPLDLDHLRDELGPDAAPTLRAAGIEPGVDCTGDVHPYGPFGWNLGWARACPDT